MLSVDNMFAFLCRLGLADAGPVIEGDLEITSSTRRNRNIIVRTNGTGYVVKQPEGSFRDATETLRREIAFYRACQQDLGIAALDRLLPKLAFANPGEAILGLEFVAGSTQLWRHYESCTAAAFPVDASYAVGGALAAIHRSFADPALLASAAIARLDDAPPNALTMSCPPVAVRARQSIAQHDLLRQLQTEEGVRDVFDAIAPLWRTETVIHGDIKLDNILLRTGDEAPLSAASVCFVDWELVQRGDRAWDIAGALRDFIFFWVISMPHGLPPEEMAAGARFPLDVLQPAIRALWQGYADAIGEEPAALEALLERSILFSAVRLVQGAFDLSATFVDVPAPADLLFRVAVNLLADTGTALGALYGLDV